MSIWNRGGLRFHLIPIALLFVSAGAAVVGSLSTFTSLSGSQAIAGFTAMILFFAIPIGFLVEHIMQSGKAHSPASRQSPRAMRIFLGAAWLIWALPTAAIFGLAIQWDAPWPFSLRQGPDTKYAIEGFESVLGFSVPGSVTDIYYNERRLPLDSTYLLRFTCCDEGLVRRVISDWALDEESHPSSPERGNSGYPSWWRWHATEAHTSYKGDRGDFLWYNPQTCTVLFERWRSTEGRTFEVALASRAAVRPASRAGLPRSRRGEVPRARSRASLPVSYGRVVSSR